MMGVVEKILRIERRKFICLAAATMALVAFSSVTQGCGGGGGGGGTTTAPLYQASSVGDTSPYWYGFFDDGTTIVLRTVLSLWKAGVVTPIIYTTPDGTSQYKASEYLALSRNGQVLFPVNGGANGIYINNGVQSFVTIPNSVLSDVLDIQNMADDGTIYGIHHTYKVSAGTVITTGDIPDVPRGAVSRDNFMLGTMNAPGGTVSKAAYWSQASGVVLLNPITAGDNASLLFKFGNTFIGQETDSVTRMVYYVRWDGGIPSRISASVVAIYDVSPSGEAVGLTTGSSPAYFPSLASSPTLLNEATRPALSLGASFAYTPFINANHQILWGNNLLTPILK